MPGHPDLVELWRLYLPTTRLDKGEAWRGCILTVGLWRQRDGTGWSIRLRTPLGVRERYEERYETIEGAREALHALSVLGEELGTWVKEDVSWEP